jgi:hypothetical protein
MNGPKLSFKGFENVQEIGSGGHISLDFKRLIGLCR